MSSHQDSYYHSDMSLTYYESSPEPSVARRLRHSWPVTATTGYLSTYSHHLHQPVDPVGDSLEVHDAEDTSYPLNHPCPNYPPPSTPMHDPGIVTDATYTNDNVPFELPADSPFSHFPEIDYRQSQNPTGYALYEQVYDYNGQLFVQDAYQMSNNYAGSFMVHPTQNVPAPQTSQGPSAPVYPHASSAQLPLLAHGGAVYEADPASVVADRMVLPNVGTSQHSQLSSVAASSNQISAAGPSRSVPSSPDKKRLSPDDERPMARRVAPRHDRAGSVHSSSPDSHRRSRSNSNAYGRGPLIPQERYTTSSISTYNTPGQHPPITFELENPHQIGIPIIDILNKTGSFARLRNRTQAFNHMGKKTFTLRVQWPGYKLWSKTIAAMDWTKSRAPITRVKLAEVVATSVRDLIEKYRDVPFDLQYAQWNVGPNGIQLDQICLVAVHHVSKGSWQPELCLLEPRR